MRRRLDAMVLAGIWLSAAGVGAGFVLPWASLDVKYRTVAGDVGGAVRDLPLGDAAERLTRKLGRIVVTVTKGAETVTGELPDLSTIPTRVNGLQIPQLINRPDAHVVVGLAEMFTGQRDLGAKSYAVYALPVLAVLLGLAATSVPARRAAAAAPLVLALVGASGLALGGGVLWKLLTTPTDALLVKVTIERGLWVLGWAYVALGALALARLVLSGRRPT